ncbi:hypothetical protein ACE15K_16175 [Citrobacter farmeri]
MGFPSPVADYIGRRLTVDAICGTSMNSRELETSVGYAVIDVSLKSRQGEKLIVLADGEMQFVKLAGKALISEEGEVLEGLALDGVELLGIVRTSSTA